MENLNLVSLDFIQALFVYLLRGARVTRSFSVSGVQIQFKAIIFYKVSLLWKQPRYTRIKCGCHKNEHK
jgi:hypothetical protein